MTDIRALLAQTAAAKATHDGAPAPKAVHILAAANELQMLLRQAAADAIAAAKRPPPPAAAAASEPAPEAQPTPPEPAGALPEDDERPIA